MCSSRMLRCPILGLEIWSRFRGGSLLFVHGQQLQSRASSGRESMVRDGTARLMQRRETFDDLMAREACIDQVRPES